MTAKGFNTLFGGIGERAGLPFPVHRHMLRAGNAGHDPARCRLTSVTSISSTPCATPIQHTVRYTELSPHRFKNFWR